MEDVQQLARLFGAIDAAGGESFVVGGFVRDFFMGIDSKDIDIEVHGLTVEQVHQALKHEIMCMSVDAVGKAFGVFKVKFHTPDGGFVDLDVSLPRTESKVGPGHTGFDVTVDPHLGIEKALARRDFTMNAIAFRMGADGEVAEMVDPFKGMSDITHRQIRMVGPAFSEDPLRVLRAVQFACRFGMSIEPETAKTCRALVEAGELDHISKERIWTEWAKIGTKGKDFRALEVAIEDCGLQGRWGVIWAPRKLRLEHLEGDHRTMVVLAAVNVNVSEVDAPNHIREGVREIISGLNVGSMPGVPQSTIRMMARTFKRATWADVTRIDPTILVDPWVLDGPLPIPVTADDVFKIFPKTGPTKPGPWVGEMIHELEACVDADPMFTEEQAWMFVVQPTVEKLFGVETES